MRGQVIATDGLAEITARETDITEDGFVAYARGCGSRMN